MTHDYAPFATITQNITCVDFLYFRYMLCRRRLLCRSDATCSLAAPSSAATPLPLNWCIATHRLGARSLLRLAPHEIPRNRAGNLESMEDKGLKNINKEIQQRWAAQTDVWSCTCWQCLHCCHTNSHLPPSPPQVLHRRYRGW